MLIAVLRMGILLGKFAKTENKGKSAVKQTRPILFGSRKAAPVLMKANQTFSSSNKQRSPNSIDDMKSNGILDNPSSHQDDSVATPSVGWDFEDEYKSYLQKSIKRKNGSDNTTSHQRKLRKISQEQSDLHDSLACDVLIDKIQTSPNTSTINFSGNLNKLLINGTMRLDRLSEIAPDSCFQIDHDKSLNIQNIKAKIRTCSRSYSTNNSNNKKLKNLQLMQLTYSEPRVVLDQTIVSEYLNAKRIIDRIMKKTIEYREMNLGNYGK